MFSRHVVVASFRAGSHGHNQRPLSRAVAIATFTSTSSCSKIKYPPRPKPPPDSEFTEVYLKGTGPGGQKIVRPCLATFYQPHHLVASLTPPHLSNRTRPAPPSSSNTSPPASLSSAKRPARAPRTASWRGSTWPPRSTTFSTARTAGPPWSPRSSPRRRRALLRRPGGNTARRLMARRGLKRTRLTRMTRMKTTVTIPRKVLQSRPRQSRLHSLPAT